MVFGNRLVEFFKNKRISNRILAKEIGFSESMVGRYMKNPNLKFLIAVIKIYPDLDLNFILKEDDTSNVFILKEAEEIYGRDNVELLKIIEEATRQLRENLALD